MMSGEKVICRRVSDGVLINIPHTFDLKQIADSGQCFRLTTAGWGICGGHRHETGENHTGYQWRVCFSLPL